MNRIQQDSTFSSPSSSTLPLTRYHYRYCYRSLSIINSLLLSLPSRRLLTLSLSRRTLSLSLSLSLLSIRSCYRCPLVVLSLSLSLSLSYQISLAIVALSPASHALSLSLSLFIITGSRRPFRRLLSFSLSLFRSRRPLDVRSFSLVVFDALILINVWLMPDKKEIFS